MEIHALKQSARGRLRTHWKQVLVLSLISLSLALLKENINIAEEVLDIIIFTPISVGISWLYLDIFNQKDINFYKIFESFHYYSRIVFAGFLIPLFVILWSFIFIIPGVIKACAYSQTFFLLKENPHLKAFEAMKMSEKLMLGKKKEYILMVISFMGWIIIPIFYSLISFNIQMQMLEDTPQEVSLSSLRQIVITRKDNVLHMVVNDEEKIYFLETGENIFEINDVKFKIISADLLEFKRTSEGILINGNEIYIQIEDADFLINEGEMIQTYVVDRYELLESFQNREALKNFVGMQFSFLGLHFNITHLDLQNPINKVALIGFLGLSLYVKPYFELTKAAFYEKVK